MIQPQFEIVDTDGFYGVLIDHFTTKQQAKEFAEFLIQAVTEKQQSDQAQIEVDAIDQSLYKDKLTIVTNLLEFETWNRLTELANLKGMTPKEVLKMAISNELIDHVDEDMEFTEELVIC